MSDILVKEEPDVIPPSLGMKTARFQGSFQPLEMEIPPLANDALPDYEPMLEAYHQAFATELETMIRTLPILEGNQVLEMACGDGAYTPWLVEMSGASGRVIGLDVSPAYLERAREEGSKRLDSRGVDFVAGSIERLPFADRTFDLVWCAQSLFSLPEPVEAVRRMARIVKPGGFVAVLEDDTLHQVLLPWPVEIELALRTAEWESLREESNHPDKFYVGRKLVRVFREAGLSEIQIRSFATSKLMPLDDPTRRFLSAYLDDLRGRVNDRLTGAILDSFLKLIEPDSKEFLIDQPDFHFTLIDHVIQGRLLEGWKKSSI